MIDKIKQIYENWRGCPPKKIEELPPSASPRKYFRLYGGNDSVIVAHNSNAEENEAFIVFARHFHSLGFNVPEILFVSENKEFYILQDLGDKQLYHEIRRNGFSGSTVSLLKKSIDGLLQIQLEGLNGLDLSVAFPRAEFDARSIMWDLHYFKYYFLKLAEIDFHEERLENDFEAFTDFLLEADRNYFLFRDFQTRNIMILNGEPFFIDFQGGRKGALQYDIASLLYDANAKIPKEIRDELLEYYVTELAKRNSNAAENFEKYYFHYVLVRMLQALGAFGFRGLVQRKQLFIEAIPPAIENLQTLLNEHFAKDNFPELFAALRKLKNFEAK